MNVSQRITLLKEIRGLQRQIQVAERDFQHAVATEVDAEERLEKSIVSWSELYSLPFIELLALYAVASDSLPTLEQAAEHSTPLDIKYSFLSQILEHQPSTDFLVQFISEKEARKLATQLFFALVYSMKALAHRNRPINMMLEQIREKVDSYEEIIFEAISIDASVVGNSEIAGFIARWVISGNKDKLGKLSKAIVGKYPRGKRTVGLDDYRFMVVILEELDVEATSEAIYEMNQYLGLIAEGEDLESAIKKHLQTRRKDTRTSNAPSSS